jgi:hypothetical protein
MTIYNLYMGKGIFVTTTKFIELFQEKFKPLAETSIKEWGWVDTHEIMSTIILERFGQDIECIKTGHDFMNSSSSDNDYMFDYFMNSDGKRVDAVKSIEKYIAKDIEKNKVYMEEDDDDTDEKLTYEKWFTGDDYCVYDVWFIGKYIDITTEELSGHVKAPELIYAMSTMFSKITLNYPVINALEFPDIENVFDQPACLWSFSVDCTCCS